MANLLPTDAELGKRFSFPYPQDTPPNAARQAVSDEIYHAAVAIRDLNPPAPHLEAALAALDVARTAALGVTPPAGKPTDAELAERFSYPYDGQPLPRKKVSDQIYKASQKIRDLLPAGEVMETALAALVRARVAALTT